MCFPLLLMVIASRDWHHKITSGVRVSRVTGYSRPVKSHHPPLFNWSTHAINVTCYNLIACNQTDFLNVITHELFKVIFDNIT